MKHVSIEEKKKNPICVNCIYKDHVRYPCFICEDGSEKKEKKV